MKPTAWYDPSNGMVSTDKDCPLFTPLGQVWPLYLERTEQEPVAWMWDVNNGGGYTTRDVGLYQTSIFFAKHTPLYTHPPQRTEQGDKHD